MEQLYADRLPEHFERLAHHAVRGEVWAKAVCVPAPGRHQRRRARSSKPGGGYLP